MYLVSDQDKGCWANERLDEDSGEGVEVDLLALIAEHLKPGEVAVLKEAGSEKARYIGGRASAVNHRGETATVDLDAIYDHARSSAARSRATYEPAPHPWTPAIQARPPAARPAAAAARLSAPRGAARRGPSRPPPLSERRTR